MEFYLATLRKEKKMEANDFTRVDFFDWDGKFLTSNVAVWSSKEKNEKNIQNV